MFVGLVPVTVNSPASVTPGAVVTAGVVGVVVAVDGLYPGICDTRSDCPVCVCVSGF